MWKHFLSFVLIIGTLWGCSIAAGENGQVEKMQGIEATVVHVVDGDTIDVKFNDGRKERVRMLLVDTPETKHPRLGVQPFGPEASAFTKKSLYEKKVVLEMDVSERDKYGRVLAYVWLENENFNRMLLEEGLARVAIFPPDLKYLDEFEKVQEKARQNKLGIWSLENYVHDRGFENANSAGESKKQDHHGCDIKGNINSKKEKIYHVPGGQHYDSVIPEMWFCSKEEAENAGFRPSKR
ncbi:thermonuclease family protein [Siminovitchia sp. 179-K 8D1 HS]|uniref:thermonuclease family protein n=1 Tax=Siminovitchia sp. 179-K 8D1 HS TaxID=3142385 RepID=UPI0039A3D441